MCSNDGFTLVTYKHPKQNRLKKQASRHTKDFLTEDDLESSGSDQLLASIINCIEECKHEIKGTTFYKKLLLNFSQFLSSSDFEVTKFHDFVCYGIGKVAESLTARYQFALLVLLWQHFDPAGKCYIYDPVFGVLDRKIVEHFGLDLIHWNEEAKRKVFQRTLFFVPHGCKALYNNILWANWGHCLENVVIFGNSFASYIERIPSHQLAQEAHYIFEILPLTCEVPLATFVHDDVFNDMSLHYFVHQELAQKPSSFWLHPEEPSYDTDNTEIILNSSG